MNDRQRNLFVDVVDLGSFSKAAERHFVTPQSVSQQIRRLEGELGFELLERGPQGVRPTDAGEAFYQGCRGIDRELDELVRRCTEMAAAGREAIRLGSSGTYSLALFSRFVPQFLRDHPDVRLEYVDVDERPLEGLLAGTYDVIESVRPADRALAFCPLASTRRCCLVSPRSPLARREVIEPADLAGRRTYVFNLRWAARLQHWLAERCPGVELTEIPSPDLAGMQRALEDGEAVYLIPEQLKGRGETLIPIPFACDVETEYGLAYLPQASARLQELLVAAEAAFGQGAGT